jgi:hypothetical protein
MAGTDHLEETARAIEEKILELQAALRALSLLRRDAGRGGMLAPATLKATGTARDRITLPDAVSQLLDKNAGKWLGANELVQLLREGGREMVGRADVAVRNTLKRIHEQRGFEQSKIEGVMKWRKRA